MDVIDFAGLICCYTILCGKLQGMETQDLIDTMRTRKPTDCWTDCGCMMANSAVSEAVLVYIWLGFGGSDQNQFGLRINSN